MSEFSVKLLFNVPARGIFIVHFQFTGGGNVRIPSPIVGNARKRRIDPTDIHAVAKLRSGVDVSRASFVCLISIPFHLLQQGVYHLLCCVRATCSDLHAGIITGSQALLIVK